MVAMSDAGSMRPSTWVTSPSSKQRTTWAMASHSRILAEELVAEALALGGAAHEAGDIDEGEPGRDDFLRARDLRQRVEARVRHRHVAGIGFDGAERIVGRLRRGGLGQRVEKGRLADIRQADDAAFESHEAEAVALQGGAGGLCAGVGQKASGEARRPLADHRRRPYSTIRPGLDYRRWLKLPSVSGPAMESGNNGNGPALRGHGRRHHRGRVGHWPTVARRTSPKAARWRSGTSIRRGSTRRPPNSGPRAVDGGQRRRSRRSRTRGERGRSGDGPHRRSGV